jgi:hypothetical protein
MSSYDYDLFVIGGGSGGVRSARVAAALGKKVAIAEEYRYGGTCVIRGCVPKKLFVYASQYHEHFEDAAGFGWTVGKSSFDWKTLIAAKDAEIARLEGLYKKGPFRSECRNPGDAGRADRCPYGAPGEFRSDGDSQDHRDCDRRSAEPACGPAGARPLHFFERGLSPG